MSVETDKMLVELGRESERERIANWVRENRTAIELVDGVFMYRDHFTSESLLEFIEGVQGEDKL
jgi:hypothetical protein